ncbi:MAG: hypothetical protein V1685_03950 [Parcubacteria group bacterium]
MASRSVKRSKAGSHVKVKTFYVVLCAALLGVVFALPSARAQWFEPPLTATPGGQNTDAPIYGAANPAYGGNSQARLAPLTIGAATPFSDATVSLYVYGKTLVQNALTVDSGPAIAIPDSAITGLSSTASGVYGISSNAAGAGVLGETSITGGKALIGDAGAFPNAVGVHAFAFGNNSMALAGNNATGFAGYFEGKMKISGDYPSGGPSGVYGDLIVTGDSIFRSNLTVANLLDINSLTIKGSAFEADKVNALSVQDQESTVPADDPGIGMFTLSSADTAFCPNCTSDGVISPWTILAWDVGPSSVKPLIDETKVILGYTAQYLGGGAGAYATLLDFSSPTLEYQECDATGKNATGTFRLTNDAGVDARFRLQVWYKTIPTAETCAAQPWREVTVSEAVDLGDSVHIGATGVDASAIFNKTTVDQIRLFYVPTSTEIDIDITRFTAANIDIWFKAKVTTAGADATNYALYYGNGGNYVNPALRDRNYVYTLWDNFDDNSLDESKWTSYVKNAISSVTEDTQMLNLRHDTTGGSQWTGSSAWTTISSYPKTGRYTISFLLNPETSDANIGNDGFFIRNAIVSRETAYYGGPSGRGIYFGLANTCAASGISVRTRGASPPSPGWFCGFGTNSIGAFAATYSEGTWYPFEVEFNADTGWVNIQQPIGTSRVSGTANAADYATIVGSFVLEMHDAFFTNVATSANERYDDFIFRRGRNSFDPPASLGPEN